MMVACLLADFGLTLEEIARHFNASQKKASIWISQGRRKLLHEWDDLPEHNDASARPETGRGHKPTPRYSSLWQRRVTRKKLVEATDAAWRGLYVDPEWRTGSDEGRIGKIKHRDYLRIDDPKRVVARDDRTGGVRSSGSMHALPPPAGSSIGAPTVFHNPDQ
jgi:hypothetical protein